MPRRRTSLRRNDSDKVGQELHGRGESYNQMQGDSSAVYLATLINPVDHRLYDVVYADRQVHIVAPMPNEEYVDPGKSIYSFGEGHADLHDTKDVEMGRIELHLARSHTPGGVGKKGSGQGLILYCGLSIYTKFRGLDGVYSSVESRSEAATKWWRTQVDRGFADEDSAHVTGYTTTEVDLESAVNVDDFYARDLFDKDSDAVENIQITDISPSAVEVELSVEGTVQFQYLSAEKVAESGYCVAWNTEDSDIDELFSQHGQGQPKEVILGIDLSTTADPILIQNLIVELKEADATEEELVLFLNRVPKRLFKQMKSSDVKEIYGQLRLPLPEDEELAANASTKTHSRAWKDFFGEAVNSN
jgi:hypothetical protein